MRTALVVVALMAAAPAFAEGLASVPRRALLMDSEGQKAVSDTKASFFLIGLGLTGAGLLLGGAGFGVLYACREGQQCHDDKTLQTVGWVLAAPGVVPLAIGLIMLYISVGGKSGGGSHAASSVALGLQPVPGGAVASAAFRW
jgi:hypothetical protein